MTVPHKSIQIFLFTILMYCLYFVAPVFAATDSVLVIDGAGQKEKLTDPRYEYSDAYENNIIQHFEVILSGSPSKSIWVHYSQIKTATFKKVKNGLGISIALDNGEVLSGMFPDEEMKIEGKGDLGEATYDIKQIRSIEFLKIAIFNSKDNEVNYLSRKAASSLWKKQRETLPRWTIALCANVSETLPP